MEATLAVIVQNQEDNSEKLNKLVTILEGNGDPRDGLVVRFDRVEQQFLTDRREESHLKKMLIGSIVGFIANAGLFIFQLAF
jgi:hypothetical protein